MGCLGNFVGSARLTGKKKKCNERQANWHKCSRCKSCSMKFNQNTYFREPCVVIREGPDEVSAAVRVAGAIEQRNMHYLGRRGCVTGRRHHVGHRYGERIYRPTVSRNSGTHVRTLPGPGRSPSCPVVVRGRLEKAEDAEA